MSWRDKPGRDLFAYGGGGAKGGFQWGISRVLWTYGVLPDAVWGVSVGSLTGYLMACHNPTLMDEVFLSIKRRGRILRRRFFGLLFKPVGQYSMKPLMKNYIRKYGKRANLKVPYHPVWVSLNRGTADGGAMVADEAWSYDSDTVFQDAMRASSTIPVIMQYGRVYDEIGLDGGVADVVPARWALEAAEPGDRVWIVACRSPDDLERWRPKNDPDVVSLLKRETDVAVHERIRNDLSDEMIREATNRGVRVHVIWPGENHGSTLDFDQKHLNGWRRHGENLMSDLMKEWYPDEDHPDVGTLSVLALED